MEECGVRKVAWVKDIYEKKFSWATADNEEELNFRSSYGITVLQTQFPELERSGAISFTRKIFSRYRECLKRCVKVTILECIEREEGCIYVIQKYQKPQMWWDVYHLAADNSFKCSCLRMESFGLPCVHILAVLVRLDMELLPKSLVLMRWSKWAKDDAAQECLSCQTGDAVALYRSQVGTFLQHCKCFAKVACVREEDFRHFVEKVVRDTHMLEERSMLESHGTETSNIAGTKGTGRSNDPVGMRGVKRRPCNTCGCVGHRRTRCLNVRPPTVPGNLEVSTQGKQTSPAQGWVPGIYTSHEDFLEQTHEHQYCSWQKHDTLEEALDAWLVYFGGGNRNVGKKRITDGEVPDPIQPDDRREKEKNALRALQAWYHQEEMVNPQPTGLVPNKPLKDPLIHVGIRTWLDKACDKLDIPNPIYRCLMQTYHDGRRCTVTLSLSFPHYPLSRWSWLAGLLSIRL
ncbi:hypothetical protein AHAS_Ahas15G0106800 [Arachis hypogaea]